MARASAPFPPRAPASRAPRPARPFASASARSRARRSAAADADAADAGLALALVQPAGAPAARSGAAMPRDAPQTGQHDDAQTHASLSPKLST